MGIRALRDLYEDDGIASKRPWLLQPVLSSVSHASAEETSAHASTHAAKNTEPNTSKTLEEVPTFRNADFVSVLDPRARAGSPPFDSFHPASARQVPRVRCTSRPCSARAPSSARAARKARPKSAIPCAAMTAEANA